MKNITKISYILGLAILLGFFFTGSSSYAQQGKGGNAGRGFVDNNGDGINDYAIDSDNDGIPNCLDSDYVRPMDGTGRKLMKGSAAHRGLGKYGPGNGTGNQGVGPKDGTGYGSGSGTGICDGTGPKGNAKRGGRK